MWHWLALGATPAWAGIGLLQGALPTFPGPASMFPDKSQPSAFTSLSLPNIIILAGLVGMGHS